MPLPLPVIGFLAGAQKFLAKIPREVWYALAIIAGLWLLRAWHNDKVSDALADGRAAGRTEQAAADTEAFRQAQDIATERQSAVVRATERRMESINERTTDDLTRKNDDLSRRYDDLRLRWARATAEANPGGAGHDEAASAAGAAAGFDAAACAAQGWVSFDSAATLAEAADRAIAKDDAWIAWATKMLAAWPKD